MPLRRNDAYLEVVESHALCPFARACRERGRLHRVVVPGDGTALDDGVHAQLLALEAGGDLEAVEVALLLAPDFSAGAHAFEALAARARQRVGSALGRPPAFFVVAFHPDLPGSDADAHRLVGLLRRTPDPTLQVVRASVLDALRGATVADKVYVDPADGAALAAATRQAPAQSLSERIAAANLATWRDPTVTLASDLASLCDGRPAGAEAP